MSVVTDVRRTVISFVLFLVTEIAFHPLIISSADRQISYSGR